MNKQNPQGIPGNALGIFIVDKIEIRIIFVEKSGRHTVLGTFIP